MDNLLRSRMPPVLQYSDKPSLGLVQFKRRDLRCFAVSEGYIAERSATAAETHGAAIEVPLSILYLPKETLSVTATEMAGLSIKICDNP